MRVVVTGAAGRLAAALLPKLCANPAVASVVGLDRVPPSFAHAKFSAVTADVRDAQAGELLRNASALVHLAFILQRGRMSLKEMRSSNVDGSKAMLASARRMDRIVHLSTAGVYGSGEDLPEQAPLSPWPRFHYACQKAEIEAWIARELPHAVVLRPTLILGPHAQPLLLELIRSRFYVRLPDPQPLLQCVHEEDVTDAIIAALVSKVNGAFNLAAPEAFALRDLVRWCRPRAWGVPLFAARAAVTLAWRTTGWGGEPGWLDGIGESLTLDCRKAASALHWQPRFRHWRQIVAASPPQ